MTQPTTASKKLLAYWRSQPSVHLNSPAPETAVRAFEARYGVALPASMRAYLLEADGFVPPGDQDLEGFSFWPVERMVSLCDYESGRLGLVGDVYLFADYLDWSWGYGIRLKAGVDSGVCIVGTADSEIVEVAGSFEEFVELYISDDEKIYIA